MSQLVIEEEARMKIQYLYSLSELMECPGTRAMILDHNEQLVTEILRPVLEDVAGDVYRSAKEQNLNVLDSSSEGQFVGGVVGLVMAHLSPRLLDEVVYEQPTVSLAHLRGDLARTRETHPR